MAWVDTMRLRRRAGLVRMLGWANLFMTIVGSALLLLGQSPHDLSSLAVAGAWATTVMAVTHSIAWMIDRRANQVVAR